MTNPPFVTIVAQRICLIVSKRYATNVKQIGIYQTVESPNSKRYSGVCKHIHNLVKNDFKTKKQNRNFIFYHCIEYIFMLCFVFIQLVTNGKGAFMKSKQIFDEHHDLHLLNLPCYQDANTAAWDFPEIIAPVIVAGLVFDRVSPMGPNYPVVVVLYVECMSYLLVSMNSQTFNIHLQSSHTTPMPHILFEWSKILQSHEYTTIWREPMYQAIQTVLNRKVT